MMDGLNCPCKADINYEPYKTKIMKTISKLKVGVNGSRQLFSAVLDLNENDYTGS